MSVGTYSPWEPTATLRSGAVGSAARGASAPTEGGEGRGHIVAACRTACSIRLCRLAVLGPVIIIDVWRAGARRASGPLLTQSDCWDCWLMCCVWCAGADDVNWVINWYSYQLSVISTAADRHLHHLPYLFFPQSYCMHCDVCIVVSVQVYCKCVWLGLVSRNSAYRHLLAAVNRVKAHSVQPMLIISLSFSKPTLWALLNLTSRNCHTCWWYNPVKTCFATFFDVSITDVKDTRHHIFWHF